ncbi:MAG: DoxD-like family protein [Halobacteriovoraceae bacterium]|nr:DoxD-like family protein [Halobacteriovoraceae bacterium]
MSFLFSAPVNSKATDTGLLIFRLFIGLNIAFMHGMGKVPPADQFVGMVSGMGFPAPSLFAWLAGLAELGGGILIAVGLLTSPAAIVLAINMAVAGLIFHSSDPWNVKELAFMFLFSSILLAFTGAGVFSVDSKLGKRN